jgi:hypothetical protein
MNNILKRTAIGFLPIIFGFTIFIIYQTTEHYTPVGVAFISCLGPPLLIVQHLPITDFILILLLTITLILPNFFWLKWYTAIIAIIGAYIWCIAGMIAVGASC